jgi:hypothetical protein
MIGGARGSPYASSCQLAEVFSSVLLAKCAADPKHLSPAYYTSIDAVSAKNVLVGSQHYISFHGYPPLTAHFCDINGDFQLKLLLAYLGTGETCLDAFWHKMSILARYITCDRRM